MSSAYIELGTQLPATPPSQTPCYVLNFGWSRPAQPLWARYLCVRSGDRWRARGVKIAVGRPVRTFLIANLTGWAFGGGG